MPGDHEGRRLGAGGLAVANRCVFWHTQTEPETHVWTAPSRQEGNRF